MRKEGKEIIAHLYPHYGSGRTIKINDLLKNYSLTTIDAKAMLLGLEALGYIANNSGASSLANMDRGHEYTLDNTEIWAMLTADGFKFHESQLDRKLQTDLTQSVMATNTSTRGLNDKTKSIYCFQKMIGVSTIIVGLIAVFVPVYLSHNADAFQKNTNSQIERLSKQIEQLTKSPEGLTGGDTLNVTIVKPINVPRQ